jgi:hypothetical protein
VVLVSLQPLSCENHSYINSPDSSWTTRHGKRRNAADDVSKRAFHGPQTLKRNFDGSRAAIGDSQKNNEPTG